MGAGAGGNFGNTRGAKGHSKREELLNRATNQKLKNTEITIKNNNPFVYRI